MQKPSAARERIIETASQLFYQDGFRAVGVDRAIEKSSVAKATFYKHFRSKEALIVAYLEGRNRQTYQQLVSRLDRAGKDPCDRALGIFDFLSERVAKKGFRGCAFQLAMPEVRNSKRAAAIARRHKETLLALFESLLTEAGARAPNSLARQFLILYEGALATAMLLGDTDAPAVAKLSADTLLRTHLQAARKRVA